MVLYNAPGEGQIVKWKKMRQRSDLNDFSTLGIQREELYCRNESVYDTGYGEKRLTEAHRKCVAMSW